MGLRSGVMLNELCPGATGPSDIDHVIHNGKIVPERAFLLEYKDGAPVSGGQGWLFRSLSGDWEELNTGRRLSIRWQVLPAHGEPEELEERLQAIVEWVWPGQSAAA